VYRGHIGCVSCNAYFTRLISLEYLLLGASTLVTQS